MARDSFYPPTAEYWVDPAEAHAYPLRYGDLCATPRVPELRRKTGKYWHRVLVLSPSCEMGAKATDSTQVLVARVYAADDGIGEKQRAAVRMGWQENGGRRKVAHAATMWLAPPPNGPQDRDLFADFRTARPVPLADLRTAGRVAAMTHEARLYLIRREMGFRYRWMVDLEAVRAAEAERIRNDEAFEGPRPDWAL